QAPYDDFSEIRGPLRAPISAISIPPRSVEASSGTDASSCSMPRPSPPWPGFATRLIDWLRLWSFSGARRIDAYRFDLCNTAGASPHHERRWGCDSPRWRLRGGCASHSYRAANPRARLGQFSKVGVESGPQLGQGALHS